MSEDSPKSSNDEESVDPQEAVDSVNWKEATSIHDFKAINLDGELVSLEKYKGHVCIILNVASRCGHTKSNYEQLVKLYEEHAESNGLRILAFPCNQFGGQEPGDSEKICKFVKDRKVEFDVFEKISVNGKKAHPLWNYLTDKLVDETTGKKAIKWNFTKFIIDKDGQPVKRCKPATKPLDMVEDLEKYW